MSSPVFFSKELRRCLYSNSIKKSTHSEWFDLAIDSIVLGIDLLLSLQQAKEYKKTYRAFNMQHCVRFVGAYCTCEFASVVSVV